jgi:hypothetical protein
VNSYRIPAINFPHLQERIEKLNKRAKKLGIKPVVLTIIETITERKVNEIIGFHYQETYHLCVITGDSPKLSGWTLVAVIEPVPDGENLLREVPGEHCPSSFRKTTMHCDHCGSVRKRNAIFVLRHDDGDHKQVGRNCIADFLGHEHPESMLSKAEHVFTFDKLMRDAQEEGWGSAGGVQVVPLEQFVITTSVVIRKLGWLPRSKASDFEQATSDIVWDICTRSHEKHISELVRKKDLHAEESDIAAAKAAIGWGASIPDTESSTYLYDLGVCCRQQFVNFKMRGYVASLLQAHKNMLSKQQESNSESLHSKHIGEIKQREEFRDVVVVLLKDYVSGIYNKTLIKFRDPQGNILIWRASGCPDWVSVGKKFTIKATVKGHSEFNGTLQTDVIRVVPVLT